MPSALPVVSRRRMLVGTAAFAALAATVAACGGKPATPPPDLDDLRAQLERAHGDSQLASDAAAVAKPPLQPALAAVSADRAKHAEALSDEIARLTGETTTTSTASTTAAAAPPVKPPTAADVVAALRASADSATQLAPKMTGYRAGLLASIAAYCTAAYTVALA